MCIRKKRFCIQKALLSAFFDNIMWPIVLEKLVKICEIRVQESNRNKNQRGEMQNSTIRRGLGSIKQLQRFGLIMKEDKAEG